MFVKVKLYFTYFMNSCYHSFNSWYRHSWKLASGVHYMTYFSILDKMHKRPLKSKNVSSLGLFYYKNKICFLSSSDSCFFLRDWYGAWFFITDVIIRVYFCVPMCLNRRVDKHAHWVTTSVRRWTFSYL